MGNDPKTRWSDQDCQLHDVDNVYVIDASVHVTNGGFNPALTIWPMPTGLLPTYSNRGRARR